MQITTRQFRITAMALLAGALTALGCSDKSPTESKASGAKVKLSINNSTGSAVLFDVHNASLQVGYGSLIEAHVLDASGNAISGAHPTWTSSSATIATVQALPDSGFNNDGARASVGARSAGSALIIASYDGSADTAHFTIEPGSGPPAPTPTPYVRPTKFTLTARAAGFVGGADSSKWVFTPVPGSVVKFVQLPGIAGDTIPPAVTPVTVPTTIATATADASGMVTFTDMPAARYRLEVTTPAASEWASHNFEYYAPYWATMRLDLLLVKK